MRSALPACGSFGSVRVSHYDFSTDRRNGQIHGHFAGQLLAVALPSGQILPRLVGVCPNFVGLGRWPFRLAVNGQAQAKMRR